MSEKKIIVLDKSDSLRDSIIALIDSQPSELVAEKGCNNIFEHTSLSGQPSKHCSTCHGTGLITRTLTRKEALEVFIRYLPAIEKMLGPITLPCGEKVRKKL